MSATAVNTAFASYENTFALAESDLTRAAQAARAAKAAEQAPEGERSAMDDYVVSLSELAKELREGDNPFSAALAVAAGGTGESEESGSDYYEQLINSIKDRIRRVKDEIEELKQGAMDDEAKQKQLAMKQSELADLQNQLQQAQEQKLKAQGGSGTGFYNTGSLT